MLVSVNVTVGVTQKEDGPWATIAVRTGDGTRGSYEGPWSSFFGVEHSVLLNMPQGAAGEMTAKTKKRRSQKQERKRIEGVGGRAHVGSGAFSGHKSDGSTDRWRMENKFTTARSYRVTLDDLTKLKSECRNSQRPVFNIDFQNKRTGETSESWVLVRHKDWETMERENAAAKPE